MEKFHTNSRGQVKRCEAQEGNCPITAETGGEHYSTREEAQKAYEEMNVDKSLRKLQKVGESRAERKEREARLHDLQDRKLTRIDNMGYAMNRSQGDIDSFERMVKNNKDGMSVLYRTTAVEGYIDNLSEVSWASSAILSNTIMTYELSDEKDKATALLNVEDARIFEREMYKDRYVKFLHLRAEIRKYTKKKIGVNKREKELLNRQADAITQHIGSIIKYSYKWRAGSDAKAEWAEFEKSVHHLLDEKEIKAINEMY